jgi:hypothetical protein
LVAVWMGVTVPESVLET